MPYWRDREEANQRLYLLEDDDYIDRLQDIYDYMQDQIQREINGFYTKYLTTEGITYAEATKRVSQLDIDEYQRKAKEYVANRDFSAQANSEMRLYNTTMKINRLELLKSEIGLELVNGFMVIDDEMKAGLTDRAIEEFTRQAGILGKTVINVSEAANSIVNASFRHATFSDRIWMYQDQLKAELDMLLRQGLIQGWNPNEMARHLDKLFDTGKYNCERLMRTELTRVQSDAQLQSFTANGFEWYQFNALGDACPACALLDEQRFRVVDAMPGENLPPIHPNCRCAVSAWMDDALYREWLDSYANHGMNYEDWLNNRPTAVESGTEGRVPSRPGRAHREDYESDEEYNAAKARLREERAAWQETVDKMVDEQTPLYSMAQEELERWCADHNVTIYNSVDEVDGRILSAFTERYEKLSADFPEGATQVLQFNDEIITSGFEIAYENTTDFVCEATHGVTFGAYCRDAVETISAQLRSQGDGYLVNTGNALNELFDHEYGHRVYDSMKYAEGRTFEERREMRDDLIANVYKKSGMSEYATTNENELFAEGFAAYYGGIDSDFARATGEFIERWRSQ